MTSTAPHATSGLSAMLARIEAAVAAGPQDLPARAAAAIEVHLREPELLASIACPSCPTGYIRHLLQADAAGRYAVVALVWRPGQMSPVHAHRTWCALGIHRGALCEVFYDLHRDKSDPIQSAALLREQGATSHGPADPRLIHRLANLGTADAVSIHVYGASFERFGQDVNQVF
jgi:predicted metal-dependent enzyme (double-stranded beta helix superfamily)